MAVFPSTVRSADLPGGRFAWLEAGEQGAPVALCLHGFPDHPRTFEPLLAPLLAAGYRVVAPWMRGYVPSVHAGPYHLRRLGQDALELAAAAGGGSPVLLHGHDWGALAGWSAAASEPERLRALVALSVPHPATFVRNLPRHPLQLLRSWYVAAAQIPFLPERLIARRDFAAIAALFEATDGRLPPYWDELRETLRASFPAPLDYYRALRRHPLHAGIVRVPTLHLTGARDAAVGVEMGRDQERRIDAPFTSAVLPANHFVHHELPDEVARRILAFVDRTAGGTAGTRR